MLGAAKRLPKYSAALIDQWPIPRTCLGTIIVLKQRLLLKHFLKSFYIKFVRMRSDKEVEEFVTNELHTME